MGNERSAQSAMEYLMTYGWAILIILVVLGILYLLHVFTPNSLLGTNSCIVQFQYKCTNPVISTNGTLSVEIGQNTDNNEYNLAVACTATTNSTGGPLANGSPWLYFNVNGAGNSTYNPSSAYRLQSGTSIVASGIPCYGTTGEALGNRQLGAQFHGILWIRYTTGPGPEGGGNTWVLQQAATISAAVQSSGITGSSVSTTTTNSPTTTATTTTTTIA